MKDDELQAWVQRNRAKIKTLRTKAIRSTNKLDRDIFTAKAEPVEFRDQTSVQEWDDCESTAKYKCGCLPMKLFWLLLKGRKLSADIVG